MTTMYKDKKLGFKMDDLFISFPEDQEIVTEDENGNMILTLDIYKLTEDGNLSKADKSVVTPELEVRINAYINEILLQAVNDELGKKHNVED